MRNRGRLTGKRAVWHGRGRWLCVLLLLASPTGVVACGSPPDPDLLPDEVLRRELGLSDDARVHTIRVTGGEAESAEPSTLTVPPGSYVQFQTTDWFVHEVRFDADDSSVAARRFLEETDQMVSPPLLQRDSRFVVSFEGAPPGRYAYRLEGNGRAGRGLIVVAAEEVR